MSTRTLTISRYKSRYDRGAQLTIEKVTWADLAEILTTVHRTKESFAEYQALPTDKKAGIKDIGYIVGGEFNPPLRDKSNLVGRDVLLLDADHLESWDVEPFLDSFSDYEYAVHSTHSHSAEQPRLRIAFPLDRTVTPAEYEPIARRIAAIAGMDYFDDTTYEVSRIMFLPSASHDADVLADTNSGYLINVDAVLDSYTDPMDWDEWPQSSLEKDRGSLRERKDKASDPLSIPGIIGAFCRAYPIDEAICEFELPYELSGMGADRYSLFGASGADGAVFYRDDSHLYSYHESDPAKGNRNAWDLVRLHKFAALDQEVAQGTPIKDMPSQKAMVALAESIPEVRNDPGVRLSATAETEFEEVVDSDTGVTTLVQKEPVGSLAEIMQDIDQWLSGPETKLTQEQWNDVITRAVMGLDKQILQLEEIEVLAETIRKRHWRGTTVTRAGVVSSIKKQKKDRAKASAQNYDNVQTESLIKFDAAYYNDGKWLRRAGKVYWEFVGTHWRTVDEEIVGGNLVEHIRNLQSNADDKKELRALKSALGEQQTSGIWNGLYRMYQHDVAMRTARNADDPTDPMGLMRTGVQEVINCNTGTIRFNKDGKFKQCPHNADDLFTSVIPVDYDTSAECPVWDAFCKTSFQYAKDPAGLQRHLEEICGYMINISRKERCWVLLYGPTNSGKSTVGKLMKEMMGVTAKPMDMGNYDGNNKHATAGLLGKQALLDDDFASDSKLNDGFIKMNSEEKHVGYNPKGGSEGELVSRAVILICSNNPPQTVDVSGALYDRAVVLPFNHTMREKEKDKDLSAKLKAEIPGIFMRFVRAFGAMTKRGGWDFPVDATEAWKDWQGKSNHMPKFLEQCYTTEIGGRVRGRDLYDVYMRWGLDQGQRNMHTRNKLYEKVDSIWGNREHGRSGDFWPNRSLIPGCLDGRGAGERDSDNGEFAEFEQKELLAET